MNLTLRIDDNGPDAEVIGKIQELFNGPKSKAILKGMYCYLSLKKSNEELRDMYLDMKGKKERAYYLLSNILNNISAQEALMVDVKYMLQEKEEDA